MEGTYSLYAPNDREGIWGFVRDLPTPTLAKEDHKALEVEFSDAEIAEALTHLKKEWAPGPNGFQSEFFKCIQSQVVPHLQDLYMCAKL
ncbi:hypothetical protein NDU88_003841 [Pleurodeles waltl]|uniref:Uncharacterized protein n=1 Tax=Pleurodeles waltl TaxID=8319 RepID=A0AAV7LI64_PLEWA|nr:hypothetical protein NDU88_003841 [Pleurodeles waltl]